uniref:Uncharacterized protein n=2 Tax=Avena sativa TaxID=4498 RepID=A0ACD5TBD5_AVESA
MFFVLTKIRDVCIWRQRVLDIEATWYERFGPPGALQGPGLSQSGLLLWCNAARQNRSAVFVSFAHAVRPKKKRQAATVFSFPFRRRRCRRHAIACAMLCLRRSILTHLFSFPAATPVPPLHRLLSAAAPRISPNPSFGVEEYLVQNCGLTRAKATKASLKLSHLKSPAKPDAVLAFLAGLGLSSADVAAVVARDPQWSDAEVRNAVCKVPVLLALSRDTLKRKSVFLISEMGLEPKYIAQRPGIITYSLEGRLRPRHYAVKFLKENGLLKRDPGYSAVVKLTEKAFMEKFICPHKEAVPHLSGYYAAAYRGEVTTNFRFI